MSLEKLFSLSGKKALIAGASRGIGLAIAKATAAAGAHTVLAARSADALETEVAALNKAGYKAEALALDVTSEASIDQAAEAHGDIDILVSNNNGPARLLLNRIADSKPGLVVRLEADTRNTSGTVVSLELENGRTLWGRVRTDASYLSASDRRVHFGLGGSKAKAIVVLWPDGRKKRFDGPWPAGPLLTIRQ